LLETVLEIIEVVIFVALLKVVEIVSEIVFISIFLIILLFGVIAVTSWYRRGYSDGLLGRFFLF
jgi:hypothetical protein